MKLEGALMGWTTGIEPATTGITIRLSIVNLERLIINCYKFQ